jgi:uncharacterized surface protein with fasciclin (FAS1) repeats
MLRSIAVSLSLALALAACGGESANDPPKMADAPASGTTATDPMATKDIIATADAAGSFKTLLAAVKAADMEGTLHGAGPFTVFAPTDDAFAKLPPGTVDSLLKPENKAKLQAILGAHVVAGRIMAADAMKLSSAKTVSGKEIKLTSSGGTLMFDKAKVIKADIQASNGVIHVIDMVIVPQ